MKKLSIILGMAAMVLGFSSCKQEDEPKYHDPNPATFVINTPALQNQAFLTSNDQLDSSTIKLYCSQPDYGYSAVCKYSALVSLNPDAPIEEWVELKNVNSSSAEMSIKTYDLGAAVNQLLNITSQEEFDADNIGDKFYKCYFKAACEISGIEGSKVISSNYTAYNKVAIQFCVLKPGWLFITGDLINEETGASMNFTEPAPSKLQEFLDNWALYEPEDLIGEKLYVGQFTLAPGEKAIEGSTNIDDQPGFRFFTECNGWGDKNVQIGSNTEDFYKYDVTNPEHSNWAETGSFEATEAANNFVRPGQGTWQWYTTEEIPMTMVVDLVDNKLYVKKGKYTVTFSGRIPNFNE